MAWRLPAHPPARGWHSSHLVSSICPRSRANCCDWNQRSCERHTFLGGGLESVSLARLLGATELAGLSYEIEWNSWLRTMTSTREACRGPRNRELPSFCSSEPSTAESHCGIISQSCLTLKCRGPKVAFAQDLHSEYGPVGHPILLCHDSGAGAHLCI
jgi:hypothetical protein